MQIKIKDLRRIIREVEADLGDLDPDELQKAVDAVVDKTEEEGGALGPGLAKQAAEEALGDKALTDEEAEEIAGKAGLSKHPDGDLVDPAGLSAIEESRKVKVSRSKLTQIIQEELGSRWVMSEGFAALSGEHQEDIIFDVYTHIREMIEKTWPNADIVPGGVGDADLDRGGLNQFTLTYEFMTPGTGTGLAGLKGILRKWKNKVAGKAGYRSEFIDNAGNKAFKMQLAKDPIRWSTEEGKRKDSDGYVALTVLITLNEDFVAGHEDIVGV